MDRSKGKGKKTRKEKAKAMLMLMPIADRDGIILIPHRASFCRMELRK